MGNLHRCSICGMALDGQGVACPTCDVGVPTEPSSASAGSATVRTRPVRTRPKTPLRPFVPPAPVEVEPPVAEGPEARPDDTPAASDEPETTAPVDGEQDIHRTYEAPAWAALPDPTPTPDPTSGQPVDAPGSDPARPRRRWWRR